MSAQHPNALHLTIPPFLPKQNKFIFGNERYVCYSGGVGSGKTFSGCHKALYLALQYPGSVGLIGAQTYRQLKDTTQKTFMEEVCPPQLIRSVSKSEMSVQLINGSVILFRTLDDETKLRSLNLGWFFIDEMTTVREQVFKQLKLRLRHKNMKYHFGFGATNPDSPNHWVYLHFAKNETNGARLITTSSRENIFLPESYIKDLESIKDEDYKARFVDGMWINLEGMIYKEFQRDIHLLPNDWQPDPKAHRFFRAMDFGYKNPFVCLFIAVDNDDRVYVFDEIYQRERLLEDHIPEIIGRHKHYFHRTFYDPSGLEAAIKMKRSGIRGLRPANNEVINGIQHVKEFLSILGEQPSLMVHPRCVNLIEEFETYVWDRDKRVDYADDFKEQPKKENDHALDALRYFIHTYFKWRKR